MADTIRPASKRRRISSSAADLHTTISQPGSIKINVSGAYIIDHDSSSSGENSPPESSSSSPRSQHANANSLSKISSSHSQEDAEQGYQHHKRDIRLPNHTATVSHVAADIGGSLAKIVYFSREGSGNNASKATTGASPQGSTESGGRLHFLSFETERIDECIEYLRGLQSKHAENNAASTTPSKQNSSNAKLSVMATGGGAFKFYDLIKDRLNLDIIREDEMECLIKGLDFFITQIPDEVFTYSDESATSAADSSGENEAAMCYQPATADVYPYLLVNIGSGVSMIKVSGPSQYQRIGGTSLGGGTLWGLLSLLTGARNFDDMLDMADRGDNANVDLLVGDIYGSGMGYEKIGLSERTIASSFGKVLKRKREAERSAEDGSQLGNGEGKAGVDDEGEVKVDVERRQLVGDGRMFKPEDISRSLLYAISNNIGQISYLQSEKHDLQRIYFGGSFIRGHLQTIHTLSFAIKFWSKGTKQAYFLRHEGYLGAVGAFLKRKPVNWGRRGSFDVVEE
ncbi:hypothetical protein MBLNU230_g5348t1 [Neophaeotheca triangularis]